MSGGSAMPIIFSLLLMMLPFQAGRKPGSRLDQLPPNIEVLTHFGERADISPDNAQIAFMAFQSVRTTDPEGAGYGILLYWFKK
jgi:hypothetical protein